MQKETAFQDMGTPIQNEIIGVLLSVLGHNNLFCDCRPPASPHGPFNPLDNDSFITHQCLCVVCLGLQLQKLSATPL